jgi:hypothetical protein
VCVYVCEGGVYRNAHTTSTHTYNHTHIFVYTHTHTCLPRGVKSACIVSTSSTTRARIAPSTFAVTVCVCVRVRVCIYMCVLMNVDTLNNHNALPTIHNALTPHYTALHRIPTDVSKKSRPFAKMRMDCLSISPRILVTMPLRGCSVVQCNVV